MIGLESGMPTKQPDASQSEWEPAFSSLKRFEALYLDRVAAKSTLADCLRDGELRAKAIVTESRRRKIHEAWNEAKDDVTGDDHSIIVEPLTWRRSKDWADDQLEWRWPFNKFSVTVSTGPFTRVMMQKVEFATTDIDRILRQRQAHLGGSPKRTEAWTLVWHTLIELARSDRLNKDSFATQKDLRNEILEEIGDSLTDETLRKPISQVWNKFVKP
ncbi:hypothetical protein ACOYW6_09550 [Parablastomonas sp. CN1-191]|uniref:hypothetical protein n=1 Tax=Parablastomonas sp. CN1-191 TaxID=3400908 RepID=UPI003BF8933C